MFTCMVVLPVLLRIFVVAKEQNLVIDQLHGIDAIGALTNVLDMAIAQFSGRNLKRNDTLCASHLIKLSDYEFKMSGQPRGSCSYCCPIIHPKKYVRLYFTNKYFNGKMTELNLRDEVGSLRTAGVKSDIPTVIYIHGFTEHGLGPLGSTLRDAYLSRPEEYNIILVDWGDLAALPWYPQAAQNTKVVSKLLSEFIAFYSDSGELPISKIHLVGFSLGAQIAGFTGKALKVKQKVPRITALDPARPLFRVPDPTQCICKDDAEYVDVIHTDGGKFGIPISLGHADFYPNGGTDMQPGCSVTSLAENKTIEHILICSHARAVEFYAESVINSEAFPAFKCTTRLKQKRCKRNKTSYMGFIASKTTTLGDFYLTTNEQSPFGRSSQD